MRMTPSPGRDLAALERLRTRFGGGAAELKVLRLRRLARAQLRTAAQLLRLHEVLCFLRAYPDDARVLLQARRMLAGFARRRDLARHGAALIDTGIAGTTIRYRFFWPTARWLAARWPQAIRLDRTDDDAATRLAQALPLLAPRAAAEWLQEAKLPAFEALDRLRGRRQATDAVCLVDLIERFAGDAFTREAFADAIDATYLLAPVAGGPTRTHAHFRFGPFAFQSQALRRERPDLREELAHPPRAVRVLPRRRGAALIALARAAMVTRARDLMAFEYGSPEEVRLIDDGDGLAFALCGVVAERRQVLPAIFAGLMLKNGVPVGYVQLDVLGPHAAVSFNLFETFRGGEAALLFARVLAVARHVFGATRFSIEPYQLGHGNDEGIESGAWWFYHKLGFRPADARCRRLARAEIVRMRANRRHRSSAQTLRTLATRHLYFSEEAGVRPALPPLVARLSGATSRLAAAGGGAAGARACEARACRLTGLRSLAGFSRVERLAWQRWAPLMASLPQIARWPAAEKRELVALVRAKGAAGELGFLVRFAAHPRLRRALLGR